MVSQYSDECQGEFIEAKKQFKSFEEIANFITDDSLSISEQLLQKFDSEYQLQKEAVIKNISIYVKNHDISFAQVIPKLLETFIIDEELIKELCVESLIKLIETKLYLREEIETLTLKLLKMIDEGTEIAMKKLKKGFFCILKYLKWEFIEKSIFPKVKKINAETPVRCLNQIMAEVICLITIRGLEENKMSQNLLNINLEMCSDIDWEIRLIYSENLIKILSLIKDEKSLIKLCTEVTKLIMDEHNEVYYSSIKLLPWIKKYKVISEELMKTLVENLKLFNTQNIPFDSYCFMPLVIQIIIEDPKNGKNIKGDAVKFYESHLFSENLERKRFSIISLSFCLKVFLSNQIEFEFSKIIPQILQSIEEQFIKDFIPVISEICKFFTLNDDSLWNILLGLFKFSHIDKSVFENIPLMFNILWERNQNENKSKLNFYFKSIDTAYLKLLEPIKKYSWRVQVAFLNSFNKFIEPLQSIDHFEILSFFLKNGTCQTQMASAKQLCVLFHFTENIELYAKIKRLLSDLFKSNSIYVRKGYVYFCENIIYYFTGSFINDFIISDILEMLKNDHPSIQTLILRILPKMLDKIQDESTDKDAEEVVKLVINSKDHLIINLAKLTLHEFENFNHKGNSSENKDDKAYEHELTMEMHLKKIENSKALEFLKSITTTNDINKKKNSNKNLGNQRVQTSQQHYNIYIHPPPDNQAHKSSKQLKRNPSPNAPHSSTNKGKTKHKSFAIVQSNDDENPQDNNKKESSKKKNSNTNVSCLPPLPAGKKVPTKLDPLSIPNQKKKNK